MIERIKEYVKEHADEELQFLKTLVSCDTTDYHEKNGQVKVEEFLGQIGAEIQRIYPEPDKLRKYFCFNEGHTYEERYCVVGTVKGTGGGRSLLLNAHMDTVFPASLELWETNPFIPVEKDGKLYGLGTADTKSGMAAMLIAIKVLKELGAVLSGDIIFNGVVDEEAGGGNGSLACIDAGCSADGVLVAEPNNLVPMSAHMGSCAFWLIITGKSAHGNMKWTGMSAFEKALPILNKLVALEQKWMKRKHELLPSPRISILQMNMGDGSITIPGECRILVNYTYLPDEYGYAEEIMGVIRDCENKDEWFQDHPIQIEPHHDCGPYCTDPQHDWPKHIAKIASEFYHRQVEVSGMPCGADGRLYSNIGKMPTVIMGPGNIENAHKPNEFVRIDQFMEAIVLYADIIYEWCGKGE